jgi:hypothetical protein
VRAIFPTSSTAVGFSILAQGFPFIPPEPRTAGLARITFNLGELFALDGLAVWNFNGFNQVGVQDVIVLGSTDGINFTPKTSSWQRG